MQVLWSTQHTFGPDFLMPYRLKIFSLIFINSDKICKWRAVGLNCKVINSLYSHKGYYETNFIVYFVCAGKSNFMDAISFVMGERTSSLRVKRLSDLIHGASIGQPISRSAQVTAVFELEKAGEKRFTRTVQGSSSDHKINGKVSLL